jgi:putative ABC transport system ATP-binding protein
MNILEINNIRYRYPKAKDDAVRGISCIFEAGKLYGITGPSGSGKTTLLSLMANLDKVTEGEIRFCGVNLNAINQNKYRAQNVGVVFQNYNLILGCSNRENVEMGLYLSGERKNINRRAGELLAKVGIDTQKSSRDSLKLSGGEQQRVAIARAMAGEPEIILADEPTGNLDGENSRCIMKLFREYISDGERCAIICTHSDLIYEYADEIIRIEKGMIKKFELIEN